MGDGILGVAPVPITAYDGPESITNTMLRLGFRTFRIRLFDMHAATGGDVTFRGRLNPA